MPAKSRSSKKGKKSKKTKHQIQPEMSQIKIITVTSGNVNDANDSLTRGEAMVEYYHPNCGHCQTLKPEWEKMCFEIRKNYRGKATIAAVDCSDQEMLNRLQIEKNFQGFPTIFHMRDGRALQEYQGERTKDALLQFAENRLPISMRRQQLKPAFPLIPFKTLRKSTKKPRRKITKKIKKKPVRKPKSTQKKRTATKSKTRKRTKSKTRKRTKSRS